MPVSAVGRLENPVAFVGEVDHLRRDPKALQRAEKLQALGYRNAKVQVVVDYKHRRLKVFGEPVRREFLVGLAIDPRRAAMLPLVKPQLIGQGVHTVEVVDAAMSDEGFELDRVSLEPVHHVAAERSTGG